MVIMMNAVRFKRLEHIISSSITAYKFPGLRHFAVCQIKYDFQCYLFEFCIAHTPTFIGFELGELTILTLDSAITLSW